MGIAVGMSAQDFGSSAAFSETMRGRFEARLGLLGPDGPRTRAKPQDTPGHGASWRGFSRLCVVPHRAASPAEAQVAPPFPLLPMY